MALYNSYNNYLSNSQHYPFILAIINHNPQLGNQTPLGNELYIYIYGYNLLPLTLSDPNNSYPSYSQHYLLVSAIIIHNPKPGNHNPLRNKLSLFLFIYNLFLPTLSDLNSNYPSYSQHYPLILVITNHNPKLGSHTQKKKNTHTHTHTTCNNWEQNFSIKVSHIKNK